MTVLPQPAAPGVYLNELPPAIPHQVVAASTSVAAFPGVYPTGPVGQAVLVTSWDDFANQFEAGGLTEQSSLAAFAVWQFFMNGGSSAYIVRLDSGAMLPATAVLGGVVLTALVPGANGNDYEVTLQPSGNAAAPRGSVDMVVTGPPPAGSTQRPPVETLVALPNDWTLPAPQTLTQLAAAITARSASFTAAPVGSAKDGYNPTPGIAGFAGGTARVGGVMIAPSTTWATGGGLVVTLAPPQSGEAGRADLIVSLASDPTGAPLERLYDLRLDNTADLAADLAGSTSAYFTAAAAGAGGWAAPSLPDTLTVDAGAFVIGTPTEEHVTLTPVASPPWQNMAAQLTPAASGATLALSVTGRLPSGRALVIETWSGLATDPPTLASGINASKLFAATEPDPNPLTNPPYAPPPTTTTSGGKDTAWNIGELKAALLAQLGDATTPPIPIPALNQIEPNVFNLMCLPDVVWLSAADQVAVIEAAMAFCSQHEAFLIVDTPAPSGTPPSPLFGSAPTVTVPALGNDVARQAFLQSPWTRDLLGAKSFTAAAYYPWVTIADPTINPGTSPLVVPPSGTVAGVYASTDASRGVWKAPAGTSAVIDVFGLTDPTMNETVNGDLNGAGINCLRTFPVYGNIVWGARTMAGADLIQSGWKYVPVRRTADFIEQSLLQSLRWAVFEPNGPPLWASIALEVNGFMNGLYGQGAFGGLTAAAAYQVICDGTTTSPSDQLNGVVNVFVGFQPVEPAEFVVVTVQLNAGPPPAAS